MKMELTSIGAVERCSAKLSKEGVGIVIEEDYEYDPKLGIYCRNGTWTVSDKKDSFN